MESVLEILLVLFDCDEIVKLNESILLSISRDVYLWSGLKKALD